MRFEPRENKMPPDLTSKLVDWEALAACGGESLIRGKRVLDLGPCYGLDAFLWAPLASYYACVDEDDHVVEWISERTDASVFQFSLLALKLEDQSFDLVLDFSSIDNTSNPWRAYHEAVRVLAPGGTLITTFANAYRVATREGETPLKPEAVREYLEQFGLAWRYSGHWHETRCALAVMRPA